MFGVLMTTLALVAVALAPLAAQDRNREIGFAVGGVTVTDFETVRFASGNAEGSVFLRIHVWNRLFVEPEVGFVVITDGDATLAILNPAFHLGRQFSPRDRPGWFAAGHVAGQVVRVFDFEDEQQADVGAGATTGYWVPVLDGHASIRVEALFRRWFDSSTSTLSLVAKVALVW